MAKMNVEQQPSGSLGPSAPPGSDIASSSVPHFTLPEVLPLPPVTPDPPTHQPFDTLLHLGGFIAVVPLWQDLQDLQYHSTSSALCLHHGLHISHRHLLHSSHVSMIKEEMRIVLLGSHADVKASCGNTIFGRKLFSESPSSLDLFERHDGKVLERRVVVINTPDLFNPALSPQDKDTRRSFHLLCPEPHALLLVLKSGTFTDLEKDAFKHINNIFGAGASEYVIVVFMHEEQKYMSIKDSESVKSLLQTSRRPHHHLQRNGDQSQVQKLLESIEKMVKENGGHHLKISKQSKPVLTKNDPVCQTANKMPLDE
ncbi:hypothetical protein Q8A67_010363 [Cirrhinus molitorella]|uniref:AIG1-type G domain-containing protein n=1 Tax=Cirrhinus molitorella TaxID=172907 RepID=A0AA88PZ93_9TELE|nr:hypothetical protein Q8A67_010363 [Cirrhinus molitorella]